MEPIRYDPETFRRLRGTAPGIDMAQAVSKLDRLYATRACFVPSHQPAAAASDDPPHRHGSHSRRHGGGSGGGHSRHHGGRPPPTRHALLKDDRRPRVERDIVATLNKVNGTNFDALRNHLLRAFAMDTDTCMRLLLDRCHMQVEYMPQYVGLMRYILEHTPECNRSFVRQRVSDFVAGFIAGRCFSAVPAHQQSEEYGDYCDWVRMKRTILGKHKTILRLLSEGLASDAADMHSYFCSLIATLYDWRSHIEEDGSGIETAEVLLDMLADFFDAELRACADVVKYLREWRDAIKDAHRDADLHQALNAKCRFKLLNILDTGADLRLRTGERKVLLRNGVSAPSSASASATRAIGIAKPTATPTAVRR